MGTRALRRDRTSVSLEGPTPRDATTPRAEPELVAQVVGVTADIAALDPGAEDGAWHTAQDGCQRDSDRSKDQHTQVRRALGPLARPGVPLGRVLAIEPTHDDG